MGMNFKGRMKKIMVEALAAAFLLVPMLQPPAGSGEGILPGEVVVESELPGGDNGGGDGIMPCGDWDDDEYLQNINS